MDSSERGRYEQQVHMEALALMRDRGGTWAAYENQAMDSALYGHWQFLRVGAGCSHATPPARYPADTAGGMGWRYVYLGMVDLQTGRIERKEPS